MNSRILITASLATLFICRASTAGAATAGEQRYSYSSQPLYAPVHDVATKGFMSFLDSETGERLIATDPTWEEFKTLYQEPEGELKVAEALGVLDAATSRSFGDLSSFYDRINIIEAGRSEKERELVLAQLIAAKLNAVSMINKREQQIIGSAKLNDEASLASLKQRFEPLKVFGMTAKANLQRIDQAISLHRALNVKDFMQTNSGELAGGSSMAVGLALSANVKTPIAASEVAELNRPLTVSEVLGRDIKSAAFYDHAPAYAKLAKFAAERGQQGATLALDSRLYVNAVAYSRSGDGDPQKAEALYRAGKWMDDRVVKYVLFSKAADLQHGEAQQAKSAMLDPKGSSPFLAVELEQARKYLEDRYHGVQKLVQDYGPNFGTVKPSLENKVKEDEDGALTTLKQTQSEIARARWAAFSRAFFRAMLLGMRLSLVLAIPVALNYFFPVPLDVFNAQVLRIMAAVAVAGAAVAPLDGLFSGLAALRRRKKAMNVVRTILGLAEKPIYSAMEILEAAPFILLALLLIGAIVVSIVTGHHVSLGRPI